LSCGAQALDFHQTRQEGSVAVVLLEKRRPNSLEVEAQDIAQRPPPKKICVPLVDFIIAVLVLSRAVKTQSFFTAVSGRKWVATVR
jgi:hypothetical protein